MIFDKNESSLIINSVSFHLLMRCQKDCHTIYITDKSRNLRISTIRHEDVFLPTS